MREQDVMSRRAHAEAHGHQT
ncbi:MAG: hypothetical protein QOI43_860, partial [Gaiellales bacterium]|nr:hypothetical protein [Gaiellales bacterium]